jgi:MEDS: MEthanogen/methylotroph, DcmR Sensory domain
MQLGSLLVDQNHFGEHNAILYSKIDVLHQLLVEYCKLSLNSLNEILLILTHYDSIENISNALKYADLSSSQKDGSLLIRESQKAYFNLEDALVDIMIMIRMLLQRKRKLGRDGLTVICDVGVFFYKKRIIDLILHETKLSLGSFDENEVRMICCYGKSNIALLSPQQKQQILSSHQKVLEV